MRLIQLNLWQGRLSRSILRFLKQQNADILTLQEVYSANDGAPLVHLENLEILEMIKNEMPKYKVANAPLYSYQVAGKPVTFSIAILSKLPIKNHEQAFTNGYYVEDVAQEAIPENVRNVQKITLEIAGQELTVVNMHSHWGPRPVDTDGSILGMQKTVEFIGEASGPTIIAGDLNVNPDTRTAMLLDRYGENLTRKNQINSTMTELAKVVPDISPDQIIVSNDLKVKNFEVSEFIASDHKALILDFEL